MATFDIVLKTKGLDKRKQDNVIIIAPADELAAREKAELAAKKDLLELAPLRTEYLQINYAKASDLAALIEMRMRVVIGHFPVRRPAGVADTVVTDGRFLVHQARTGAEQGSREKLNES